MFDTTSLQSQSCSHCSSWNVSRPNISRGPIYSWGIISMIASAALSHAAKQTANQKLPSLLIRCGVIRPISQLIAQGIFVMIVVKTALFIGEKIFVGRMLSIARHAFSSALQSPQNAKDQLPSIINEISCAQSIRAGFYLGGLIEPFFALWGRSRSEMSSLEVASWVAQILSCGMAFKELNTSAPQPDALMAAHILSDLYPLAETHIAPPKRFDIFLSYLLETSKDGITDLHNTARRNKHLFYALQTTLSKEEMLEGCTALFKTGSKCHSALIQGMMFLPISLTVDDVVGIIGQLNEQARAIFVFHMVNILRFPNLERSPARLPDNNILQLTSALEKVLLNLPKALTGDISTRIMLLHVFYGHSEKLAITQICEQICLEILYSTNIRYHFQDIWNYPVSDRVHNDTSHRYLTYAYHDCLLKKFILYGFFNDPVHVENLLAKFEPPEKIKLFGQIANILEQDPLTSGMPPVQARQIITNLRIFLPPQNQISANKEQSTKHRIDRSSCIEVIQEEESD